MFLLYYFFLSFSSFLGLFLQFFFLADVLKLSLILISLNRVSIFVLFLDLIISISQMFWGLSCNFIFLQIIFHGALFLGSVQFSSVTQLCLTVTLWTTAHQASLSITNSQTLLKLMSIKSVVPSNHLILCHPLLFLPSVFPSIRVFSNESTLHQVAKILEFQLQHQSSQWTPRTDLLQDGLAGSSCSPRDSQESSPTPQFKSINSLALSFLYSPTLTSIHDHWKNHSLD